MKCLRKTGAGLPRKFAAAALVATITLLIPGLTSAAAYIPPTGYLPETSVPDHIAFPQYDDNLFINKTPLGSCNVNVCISYVSNKISAPDPNTGWNYTLASNYLYGLSRNSQSSFGGEEVFAFYTTAFTASTELGTGPINGGWMNTSGYWNITGYTSGGVACWGTSTTGSITLDISAGLGLYDWTASTYLVNYPTIGGAYNNVVSETANTCGGGWSVPISFSWAPGIIGSNSSNNIFSYQNPSDKISLFAWDYITVTLSTTSDVAAFGCVNYGATGFSIPYAGSSNFACPAYSSSHIGQQISQIDVSPRL